MLEGNPTIFTKVIEVSYLIWIDCILRCVWYLHKLIHQYYNKVGSYERRPHLFFLFLLFVVVCTSASITWNQHIVYAYMYMLLRFVRYFSGIQFRKKWYHANWLLAHTTAMFKRILDKRIHDIVEVIVN